jgi:uncharacterized protein YndB with AHSA1/START domain
MRRTWLAAVAALSLSFACAAAAQPSKTPDVANTSFVTSDGAKTLQQSVVVRAPVAVIWKAMVDPAEFKRWNAAVMAIDLRVGGTMESSYDPARPIGDPDNIKHRIVTFLPERLIVFQNIHAPRELAHADLFQRTVTVFQCEPLGPGRTRVTISVTGWSPDPVSAQLYAFFQRDDAQILEKMKQVYEAPAKP